MRTIPASDHGLEENKGVNARILMTACPMRWATHAPRR